MADSDQLTAIAVAISVPIWALAIVVWTPTEALDRVLAVPPFRWAAQMFDLIVGVVERALRAVTDLLGKLLDRVRFGRRRMTR